MSGGGGSTTTQSQYQPPAQVLENYGALTSAGENLISQPEQQYGGPMVAGFNPDQDQAFQTVQNAQGIAQPYINAGAQEIGASTAPVWNGPVTGSDINQYESPYTQDVTHSMQALYNQENKQADENVAGNATTHGAYGGDREAVAEGITQGQMQLGENQNLAQVEQAGYQSALGEANTEQQTQLGADEANRYLESQAGYGLGNLGNEAQSTALSGASAELQTGADQQQMAQEQLNIPYEEFQAQQAYPYQQLQFMEGLDNSAAAGVGGTSTSATPAPSQTSQFLGAGLAAYGLGNSIGGSGLSGVTGYQQPYVGSTGSVTGVGNLGGSPPMFARGGRIHRDTGGIAAVASPSVQNAMAQYAAMPDEKLRELAVSLPPNSPQSAMIARAIAQRQMHPNQQGIAGASQGAVSPPQPGSPGMKAGGRTRLASGGTGGSTIGLNGTPISTASWNAGLPGGTGSAPKATTFIAGGNGIGIPQVNNSVFAGAPDASHDGLGLTGSFNPLAQAKNNAPNITTAPSASILNGIASPQSYAMPAPQGSSGDDGTASDLGALAGLALLLLKDGGRAGIADRSHHAWGGRTHYDDGGDVDDEDAEELVDAANGDLPAPSAPSPSPGSTPSAPPSSGHMTASAAPPPSASSVTKEAHEFAPDKNEILLKAGLAMMAGTSPYAGANIGRGGLAGVQEYDQQKQWDQQQQLHQDQIDRETQRDAQQAKHFADMDDKPVIDHSGDTTKIIYPSEKNPDGTPKILDLGIPTNDSIRANAAASHDKAMEDIERSRLGIDQQRADSGKFTQPTAGMGQDPNDSTKQVAGAYVTNTKTGDTEFRPGVVLTAKQAPAGADGGVSAWKYNAWLQTHPDDKDGALDFVAGHKQLGPDDALKFGYQQAARELSAGAITKDDVDARAQQIGGSLTTSAAPKRPTASAQPPQVAAPQDPMAAARAAIAAGAPRDAVIQRLQGAGINPAGL